MRTITCLLTAGALLTGCGADDQRSSTSLAPEGFDVPVSEGIKPAFESDAEKHQSKVDGFDVRGQYQEIYGVTDAPSGNIRGIAEFEQNDAVVLAWESDLSPFFFDLVAAAAEAAPLYIITPSVSYSDDVRDYLKDGGVNTDDIHFFEFQNDSFWARDFGPIPIALEDGTPAFVDQRYYPNRRRDDAVPTLMGRYFGIDTFRPNLSTEGGNFMTNGEGLCVATEWLLEENPSLSASKIREIKRDYYGCQETIILERLEGEGTGHVDMFAKFTARDTVLVGEYDRFQDPENAAILERNAERLANTRLDDGTYLRVVRIPMPRGTYPVYRSYTNSLIINDTVIVPFYDADRAGEDEALAAYREALPANYRVVTVEAEDVIQWGGAVHCVTMGYALDPVSPPSADPRPEPEPVPLPAKEIFSSAPGKSIEDGTRVEDVITVPEGDATGELVVELDIQHTYVGDLRIVLSHGDVEVELMRFEGGSADDVRRSFTVSDFAELPRGGEWQLAVEDHYQGDVGVLEGWSLSFEGAAAE